MQYSQLVWCGRHNTSHSGPDWLHHWRTDLRRPTASQSTGNAAYHAAWFTKYFTTILRLSCGNAIVTIELRQTFNLPNVLWRTQGFSSVRFTCKIVRSSEIKKGKGSPYSITERRVPELIPVLGSQSAGDVSHKPGGRLPLLSAMPAVTPATLKRTATNFAAWWTEERWVWTVCVRLLPDSVATAIWTQALLRLSPAH